jgi:hypothetical protein
MTVRVQPPRENISSMVLFTTALSASAPTTAPAHCAKIYTTAREMEMRPTSAAAKVMAGFMWPPETGLTARRRIAVVIAISSDIISFGDSVLVSKEDMTMVSRAKTNIAVPISSAKDARHTCDSSLNW